MAQEMSHREFSITVECGLELRFYHGNKAIGAQNLNLRPVFQDIHHELALVAVGHLELVVPLVIERSAPVRMPARRGSGMTNGVGVQWRFQPIWVGKPIDVLRSARTFLSPARHLQSKGWATNPAGAVRWGKST